MSLTPRTPGLDRDDPALSVVVPLYNEEGNVHALIGELTPILNGLGLPWEVILVDDGSRDDTWELIVDACNKQPGIKGVSLSRNFGHQNALFTGLHFSTGDAVITMDGDLQHPPAVLPELIHAWQQGFKVVETVRTDSPDASRFKRWTSKWFYKGFGALSGLPLTQGSSDFRLLDRQVVEVVKQMRDADLFLRGLTYWVGFPRTCIPYHAAARYAGSTKFSMGRMIRFAVASLFSFSVIPLRIGIWVGLLTSALSFLELLYIVVRYLQGNAVPGWASTLTVISFMFGILFIIVGIIGAYLGSVFETVKNRPRFLVNATEGITARIYEHS